MLMVKGVKQKWLVLSPPTALHTSQQRHLAPAACSFALQLTTAV
jgi:hypothetical protein